MEKIFLKGLYISRVATVFTCVTLLAVIWAKDTQVPGIEPVEQRLLPVFSSFQGNAKDPLIRRDLVYSPRSREPKEYGNKKNRNKVKKKRKRLKVKKKNAPRRRLPSLIKKVAPMIAKPVKGSSSVRAKKNKNTKCGKTYSVRNEQKYRVQIRERETCSIIFRASRKASLMVSCKNISVGSCDSAKFSLSDGKLSSSSTKIFCGSAATKSKMSQTDELMMTYKPSSSTSFEADVPNVVCIVRGKKGSGYAPLGIQQCPLSCGKTIASAEAEKPTVKVTVNVQGQIVTTASALFSSKTTTEPSPITISSSLSELNITTPSSPTNISLTAPSELSITTPPNSTGSVDSQNAKKERLESTRVKGGKPADVGEWPFIVYLKIVLKGSLLPCGGSILSPYFILTAAHCVYDVVKKNKDRIRVVAFEHDVKIKDDTPRQVINVRKIIVHPNYDCSKQTADIAILKLKAPLQFGQGVTPICIAPDDDYTGSPVVILGWGSLRYNGHDPDVLHEATQIVDDIGECTKNYSKLSAANKDYPVTDDHLCASAPGIDSCEGDSGGPVLIQLGTTWYQLGIVSFGHKCAVPGLPGVNTLVPKYSEWIFRTIEKDKCD